MASSCCKYWISVTKRKAVLLSTAPFRTLLFISLNYCNKISILAIYFGDSYIPSSLNLVAPLNVDCVLLLFVSPPIPTFFDCMNPSNCSWSSLFCSANLFKSLLFSSIVNLKSVIHFYLIFTNPISLLIYYLYYPTTLSCYLFNASIVLVYCEVLEMIGKLLGISINPLLVLLSLVVSSITYCLKYWFY